jgi:chromosome segregation ATPase
MQRVNTEYADRVSTILEKAIVGLSRISDGSAETLKLVKNLEALRATVSVLFQDETLRPDIHKLECELSTKNGELRRLQSKLDTMREARSERRAELDNELSVLRTTFDEKQSEMVKEQDLIEQRELSELRRLQTSFEEEFKGMNEKKQRLLKQSADAILSFTEKESSIRCNISRLNLDIQKLSQDHETASKAKVSDIASIQTQLEQLKKQQRKIENHFKMVDLNNKMKEQEKEQLRKVDELEEMATALLCDGAIALQKVWRGSKDRKLVGTMKSKQPTKGGKSKKKK